jgi:LIVCS family branched-chain amino acid:cation transporter
MNRLLKSDVVAAGLAMFSMFFGAGNVAFPLALGRVGGASNIFAITGLLITAVGFPLIGVIGGVLFNGNYKPFFNRIGVVPGFILTALIMALIGPFAAMPRCVAVAHSSLKMYIPGVSLFVFSLISFLIVYFFAMRKSKVVDLLGYVLTPILLLSLVIIIIKGLLFSPGSQQVTLSGLELFTTGIFEGYNTLDLLASIFFAGVVLSALKMNVKSDEPLEPRKLMFKTFQAGIIGSGLLALVYLGLSFVAAFQGAAIANVPKDELLTMIAYIILGPTAGIFSSIAVSLACLTTAITLAIVFSDFLQGIRAISEKISYQQTLLLTLTIMTVFSNLGFAGIMSMLAPILVFLYPTIIALTLANIAYKLIGFKSVKIPVYTTLIVTLLSFLR